MVTKCALKLQSNGQHMETDYAYEELTVSLSRGVLLDYSNQTNHIGSSYLL